jgi:RNA polymerase sigma-70 factor (ECF subfamily)
MYQLALEDEKELLLRLSGGDDEAFGVLFEHYRDRIYVFSKILSRSEFLAEEITQEVFLKIWHYRKNLAQVDFFQAYLKTTAKNVFNHYLDRIAHEKIVLKHISPRGFELHNLTEIDTDVRALQQLLLKAIDKLSPQQKKVYLMHKQQALTYEEIASELQLSVFTIKEHMQKAMANIRSFIREHADLPAILAIYLLFKN